MIRALADRGVAEKGLELTIDTLIPEVTETADGIYWHPVSSDDETGSSGGRCSPSKLR